jgi:hypothetical protein
MNNIGNIPDGKPLSIDIKKNVGNALTGPNPQPIAKTAKEAKQAAIADLNRFAAQYGKPSTLKYDKPYTFNSDVNGKNFERYYAHPKFKQLGFSPFRDNETVYNQGSSLWDDTSRAAKQFLPLAGLAVSGVYGGWDDFLSGKPDVDNAIEMERYMNIGSSSREGFGAKALNFGVNSAYTVGIIGSILTEEAVLAAASRIPGMQGLAAAGTAKNMLTLGKAIDRLYDVFKTGSEINQAKKIWNGVGKVSRAVLPFQNTADLFRTAQRAEMGWDKMNDFAKAYKSFGSFYRDLREINLVTSEAKLEGGFVQNDVANELIKQFREKEGRDPNDKESADIYDQALKAGFKTSYANIAGIYASNKVVLNKLLKGIPGAASLEHAASKSVRGTIVKNSNWLKTGKNPYEVVYGLKKFGNAEWLKQATKALPLSAARYMTANIMEGTQEVYQEAVAEAMKKYYIDTFNDPSRAHQGFMMEALNHGLKSQFSDQGLEVFLSGFLMAGPIQIAGLSMTKAGQYTNMLNLKRQEKAFANDPNNAGKDNPYTKKLNEFKDWDAKVVGAINDLTKNKKDYFSKLYRNTKEQKDLGDLYEEATLNDDTKTAVDTRDDSLFTHIKTLRKSGTLDIFKEELKALSQLSDDELAEAFNEKPGANPVDGKTVSQRIDTVLQRIDDIDKHFTEVEKVVNPYDPKQNFFKWFGFEEARDLVAYNDYSYKRIGDRMISIQEDIKNAMASVGLDSMYADIAPLFSVGRGGNILMGATDNFGMESEIDLLTKEIESLQGATDPELIRRKDRLSRKKKTLSSLSVAAQNTVVAYKLLNKPNQTQEEQDENSERVAEAEKLLHDAFKAHMQTLSERGAAGASYAMFDKTIDELFEKYKDLWRLDADKTNVANAINMLYNPEVFAQSVDRLAEAASQADAIKAEQAKKMAVEFEKRYATNDFLNDLISKFNVFVSEEEAEAYLANDIVPTKFIDADTGYEIDPRKDAKKYNEILDLIDQYDEIFFERTGQRLFKPTREDVGARVAGTIKDTDKEVNQLVPEFQKGDKRTMSDLAAEYGFDKGRVDSEVKVDTVLNAIINNKFATEAQKELARKLITLIDKTEVITFKSNHYVNSTYDTQNGIIVDPRYSSSDYQAKVSVPIEYSILNAVMQKVITDNLSNKEFSDRIAELRVLAVNASNDTEKALFRYALANNQTFLGELLTNGDFQQHLAGLEYTGEQTELTKEATTMWSKFLTILTDLLKNILNFNSSLYREAMAVTLNKLSQPTTGATTTGGTTPGPQGPSGISPNVVDKTDKELLDKLRAKYDAIIAGMSPEDSSRMNFDSWMQTDSRALEIIRKHKADKVRQQASGTQGGGPIASAAVKKNALTAVGFTIEEINSMSDTEIDDNYNRREELAKGFVPNLNSQDWGEIDVQMQAAKEKAALLKLALNADDTKYVEYDENGKPISGTEKERVSNVVKEPMTDKQPVATARGNIIDGLYKKYLLGEIQSFEEFKKYYAELQKKPKNSYVNFNDAMLEDLFDIVRKVQKDLNAKGIKVIPDFPIIAGKLGNKDVAGEMDILAYNKAGKVFIIDIKSSYANRRIGYDVYNSMRNSLGEKFGDFMEKLKANEYFIKKTIASYTDPAERALIQDKFDEILNRFPVEQKFFNESEKNDVKAPTFYVESDMAQQLAYKELLRQTTGIQADYINIFPVITSTAKAGVISQATLEREITGELMKDGEYVLNEQGLRIPTVGGYSIRVDNSKTVYDLNIPEVTQTVTTYPENPLAKKAPQPPAAPETPDSDIEAKKQEALEKKIQDLEEQRRALRSEDGSVPADKMAEFNRLNSEIKKAKEAATRGNSTNSMLIKRFADGADTATTDPEALSAEDKKEAADIIEQVIQNSKSADEAFDKIRRLGYVFDIAVTQALKSYLNDRFDPAAPKVGNNKDSFQAWIYGKTDAELDALEGDQQQGGSSQTRTYDNKPIAKGLKGKVIYITPDSYTTGDMKTHSEDLVVGNELVDEVILGLDQEALKAKLKNLSEGTSKLSKAAGGLLYFLNNVGLSKDTLSGKDNFKYLLGILESNGENSISAEIYIKALAKARELAEQGKTVVFDNTSILKFSNSLDLVITNAKSDIAEAGKTTPNNKTAIANAEANAQSTNKKRVFTESAETIITAGAKSQTPKKLKDLRALINGINNKQDLAVNELMLSTLDKTGVLDELLADQNITKDQYRALLNDKKQQIAKQLSIKDLVNKGENTLIRFLNKKGEERIGLVVKETFDGKLEIKDVTDEYNSGQGDLFVDVDDLSYGGLGSKSKSLKLAEKDVNEKVLGIMEEKKVEKSDTTTKAQSDSGQTTADQTVNERKQGLEGFDPFNPDDRKDDDNDLFNCNTVGKK